MLNPDLIRAVNISVGRPWDPPHFDCYTFLREIYADVFKIELPTLLYDAGEIRSKMDAALFAASDSSTPWREVTQPHPGHAVVMGRTGRPHHVGIWIDANSIAHCDKPNGVVVQSPKILGMTGWSGLRSYRHRDMP